VGFVHIGVLHLAAALWARGMEASTEVPAPIRD
jgi:hypothetical protein